MNKSIEEAGSPEKQQGLERDDSPQSLDVITQKMASFTRVGFSHHPVFDKFEPQHVTQFLTNTHKNQSADRWFRLVYTLIGVAVFIMLTWFLLPQWADIYFDILMYAGIFTAGGAGGYGLKSWRSQRRG
ncbi:MAG: hypothetical protein OXU96_09235 [Gammaproteobacteria bacterium]|nr:hypothetical protein [Gammaproteobacteria bacterium]